MNIKFIKTHFGWRWFIEAQGYELSPNSEHLTASGCAQFLSEFLSRAKNGRLLPVAVYNGKAYRVAVMCDFTGVILATSPKDVELAMVIDHAKGVIDAIKCAVE